MSLIKCLETTVYNLWSPDYFFCIHSEVLPPELKGTLWGAQYRVGFPNMKSHFVQNVLAL